MLYAGAYTTYVTLFKMVTTANTITPTRQDNEIFT